MPRKRRRVTQLKGDSTRAKKAVRRRRKTAEVVEQIMAYDGDQELIPAISGPEISAYRHGEYMHVSDLIHKCVRQMALSDKVAAPMPDQVIHASQGITFQLGHAVEEYVLRRLKKKSPSALYGTFSCMCEKTKEIGTYKQMTKLDNCTTCDGPIEKYHEMTLVNEELMMVGNVDFTLDDHGHLILGELKSIADKGWQDLERPMPAHAVQILLYWWMARELGIPLYDKVSILYVNKQYLFGKSPYKEFILQPSLEMRRIEEYLEDARAFKEYKDTGVMPPRLQCPHIDYTKAKQCHVKNECFEL